MTEPASISEKTQASTRQLAINVGSNMVVMALNIIIGIWFTPYLIGVLGIAAFGIATLALSISNYMAIFDSALNNAIGRFLAIDLGKNDDRKASKTFNSALTLSLVTSALLLPVISLVAWLSATIFDVPANQERQTQLVFFMAMFSYLLFFIRGVFSSSTFARNRLELQNTILATNVLLRVILTVLFFGIAAVPSLVHVGLGQMISTLVSLVLAVAIMKYLIPQIKIDPRNFDRMQTSVLLGMSGWVFVNQLGSLLFLNIDQIIINRSLGATTQGLYSSALQWSILLRSLARTFSTAIAPLMVFQFAAGNNKTLTNTSILSVKLLGLAMALPVGLISGLAIPLLRIWLGEGFDSLAQLLNLLVLPLSVNLAILPLFSLQVAYNRVKIPGIASLLFGVLNLVIALRWVSWGQYGLGVAAASAIILTIKNGLFTPVYVARIQQLPWHTYFPSLLITVAASFIVMMTSRWAANNLNIESWVYLGLICGVITLLYGLLAFGLALKASERRILFHIAYRRRR